MQIRSPEEGSLSLWSAYMRGFAYVVSFVGGIVFYRFTNDLYTRYVSEKELYPDGQTYDPAKGIKPTRPLGW